MGTTLDGHQIRTRVLHEGINKCFGIGGVTRAVVAIPMLSMRRAASIGDRMSPERSIA